MDIPDFLEDVLSLEHGGSEKRRFSAWAVSSIKSSDQNGWRMRRRSGNRCRAEVTFLIR